MFQPFEPNQIRCLIGVGGIGTGRFFALDGDHTMGREESRAGTFLERKDYCKLHIIAHCFKQLALEVETVAVGAVGCDEAGERLLAHMREHGMDLRFVRQRSEAKTLDCVVLLYSDGSGGNLTESNSACALVGAEDVALAEIEFQRHAGHGIALAAPEVPLKARAALLEAATRHRFFRAASFTSGEIPEAREMGLIAQIDLLALNTDEASALLEVPWNAEAGPKAASAWLKDSPEAHAGMILVVTSGGEGSWIFCGDAIFHQPALAVDVVSGAGAGDAFLGGFMAGLAQGRDLAGAQQVASLAGALAVTSADTIHPNFGIPTLRALAEKHGITAI